MIALKTSFITLLFGLLLLVACGSDTPSVPTAAPSPTSIPTATAPTATPPSATAPTATIPTAPTAAVVPPTAAPTATSVPKPIEGGMLVTLGDDPPTLDPHLTGDVTSARYVLEIFGGLLTIDKELAIVPDLAEEWSVSNSGTNFTFRLKPEAAFHDGRQVTAQDFKWSFERAADPATEAPTVDVFLGDIVGLDRVQAGTAAEISGVSVIDDRTLTVDIDSPKVSFVAKMTYPTSFVLDRDNVTEDPRWVFSPNATGPFRLADYEPGEVLLLSRFEDYHLGPAHLDEVRFILSGGNARLMFETDEIHVTREYQLGLDTLLDPSHPLRDTVRQGPAQFDVDYVGMNVNEPPFDDPKVRQALNYAVDRETLTSQLLQNTAVPAKGIIPPGFPGFNIRTGGLLVRPGESQAALGGVEVRGRPGEFAPHYSDSTRLIRWGNRPNYGGGPGHVGGESGHTNGTAPNRVGDISSRPEQAPLPNVWGAGVDSRLPRPRKFPGRSLPRRQQQQSRGLLKSRG